MLQYSVGAHRIDSHGSEALTKDARIVLLDTDMVERDDAFNPVEILLTSFPDVTSFPHGNRQDSPPKMSRIDQIVVDIDASDHRIELLHKNLQKYGSIYNTLVETTELVGTIHRKG